MKNALKNKILGFALAAPIGFLAIAAPAAAATCGERIEALSNLIADLEKKDAEFQSETSASEDSPLVVSMADGSTVDLRDDSPAARPFENWFGDPVQRKEVEDGIVEAKSLAEDEKTEDCLVNIRQIEADFSAKVEE